MLQTSDDWLCAGRFAGAYGIKGWVRIHSFTDPPDNLFGFSGWRLAEASGDREVECVEWRPHGKGFVARIDGIADRDGAERLRGVRIWVSSTVLPALGQGEYYWRELIGLRVYCEHAGQELLLGEVISLLETGANDVLVLKPCTGSIDDRERLVPWLPGDSVVDVDKERGRMTVRWHPED